MPRIIRPYLGSAERAQIWGDQSSATQACAPIVEPPRARGDLAGLGDSAVVALDCPQLVPLDLEHQS